MSGGTGANTKLYSSGGVGEETYQALTAARAPLRPPGFCQLAAQ